MLDYRWLLGFSLMCSVAAMVMFVLELMQGASVRSVPIIGYVLLIAGLVGVFAGQALRGLSERVAKLERKSENAD